MPLLLLMHTRGLLPVALQYQTNTWAMAYGHGKENKTRKENTTPVGVNSMRSQVLYQAAQVWSWLWAAA